MPSLEPYQIGIASAVIAAAACVQGSIGFGLALVAAPLLVLIEGRFVPGPLILNATVLTTLILLRERGSVELGSVRWAILGNAVGTGIGAAALRSISASGFSLLFGVVVLIAVSMSALGLRIQVTQRSAVLAGTASGFMGTTSSIGGPPVALLYQHQRGARLRANLSAYFLVSTLFALPALAWAGRLGRLELELALVLLPGLLLGFLASTRTSQLLDRQATRPLVLLVSGVSAILVLLRTLG